MMREHCSQLLRNSARISNVLLNNFEIYKHGRQNLLQSRVRWQQHLPLLQPQQRLLLLCLLRPALRLPSFFYGAGPGERMRSVFLRSCGEEEVAPSQH